MPTYYRCRFENRTDVFKFPDDAPHGDPVGIRWIGPRRGYAGDWSPFGSIWTLDEMSGLGATPVPEPEALAIIHGTPAEPDPAALI